MKRKAQHCTQRKREETKTTTVTTTTPPPLIALKEEGKKEFEGEKEFKQQYFFNGKQRIRLSLPLQRENAHDYQKQICESLGQSEFLSHEPLRGACVKAHASLREACFEQSPKHDFVVGKDMIASGNHDSQSKACLKIDDEDCLKSHNSQYIYSNINILDIPNDIVGIIITFTDTIGKHVFRFVNKYFHNVVHSVIVSNLLLPGDNLLLSKNFCKYDYGRIAVELGHTPPLFDWVMFVFGESESLRSRGLNIAAHDGNLNLMKHMKKRYNYKWYETTSYEAAEGGHLEVLKFLREDGCPWSKTICRYAASNGHLHVLKWLRENECPWDWSTCYGAAKYGHFEALRAALARNIKMGQRKWVSLGSVDN
jgi:hypothetical protein